MSACGSGSSAAAGVQNLATSAWSQKQPISFHDPPGRVTCSITHLPPSTHSVNEDNQSSFLSECCVANNTNGFIKSHLTHGQGITSHN